MAVLVLSAGCVAGGILVMSDGCVTDCISGGIAGVRGVSAGCMVSAVKKLGVSLAQSGLLRVASLGVLRIWARPD